MDTIWPRSGDTLFKQGGHRHLAGCVVSDFSLAATGYKGAADLLVESLNAIERNDALIFPIVFSYRQSLELRLKALALALGPFSGEDIQPIHDLEKLWAPVKRNLEHSIQDIERTALEAADACIREFAAFDPRGTAFRYPEFSKIPLHQIDLGNLQGAMNRLDTFLESVAAMWEVAG
jgi:hypothetical protein